MGETGLNNPTCELARASPLAGTFESDARKLLYGKRASPPEGPGSNPTWCFLCALRLFGRGEHWIPYDTHGFFAWSHPVYRGTTESHLSVSFELPQPTGIETQPRNINHHFAHNNSSFTLCCVVLCCFVFAHTHTHCSPKSSPTHINKYTQIHIYI